MARMKFLCDAERCIECNGCVTACKQEHDIPWGVNRRRVVTINDGVPGERSVSVACMHCSDAPCMAVCPVDCFYRTDDGVVLHDKDLCIGCGYCFYACPFGAPQFPQAGAFGVRGKMDKCTFCAGGPEPNGSEAEFKKYGRNRLAEGKLPGLRRDVLDQGAARRRRATCCPRSTASASSTAPRAARRACRRGAGTPRTGDPSSEAAGGARRPAGGSQVMTRRAWLALGGALAALGLAGCGERPQVIQYKQGTYQGKPDEKAWAGKPWNGNQKEWELAIATRNQNQNEYKRIR